MSYYPSEDPDPEHKFEEAVASTIVALILFTVFYILPKWPF